MHQQQQHKNTAHEQNTPERKSAQCAWNVVVVFVGEIPRHRRAICIFAGPKKLNFRTIRWPFSCFHQPTNKWDVFFFIPGRRFCFGTQTQLLNTFVFVAGICARCNNKQQQNETDLNVCDWLTDLLYWGNLISWIIAWHLPRATNKSLLSWLSTLRTVLVVCVCGFWPNAQYQCSPRYI